MRGTSWTVIDAHGLSPLTIRNQVFGRKPGTTCADLKSIRRHSVGGGRDSNTLRSWACMMLLPGWRYATAIGPGILSSQGCINKKYFITVARHRGQKRNTRNQRATSSSVASAAAT